MSESHAPGGNQAYTTHAVEMYLRAAARQRVELTTAIAQARGRRARALEIEAQIGSLEQRVGKWFVEDVASRIREQGKPRASLDFAARRDVPPNPAPLPSTDAARS